MDLDSGNPLDGLEGMEGEAEVNRWVWTAAVYQLGFAATAAMFAASGAHINSDDELWSMIAFCMFWPLTWAYVAFAFVVLLCLGWRGGPIW